MIGRDSNSEVPPRCNSSTTPVTTLTTNVSEAGSCTGSMTWMPSRSTRHPRDAEGFLFTGARPLDDYCALVADRPLVRDRPEEREPLLSLNRVLQALDRAGVRVPAPSTWVLPLDAPLPDDLSFPLFVRTAESSWKKGGRISRVTTPAGLEAEAALLRRALGWDATILARQWLDLAPAGEGRYGPVPQEVRTWLVDG